MIGGEAADHGVGGEPGTLTLLVDLDPARPPQEIVGVGRERAAQLGGRHLDRSDRRGRGPRPLRGDVDRLELGDPRAVRAGRRIDRLRLRGRRRHGEDREDAR